MSEIKVIVVHESLGYLRQGTILNNCVSQVNESGEELWYGLCVTGPASWFDWVPKRLCEIWDEEKHDKSQAILKKYLAQKNEIQVDVAESEERATFALLKAKYGKE